MAPQDAVFRIHAVMERHFDGVANVAQRDIEIVLLDAMRDVAQNQVAIAVFARDFERRLVVARPAPTGKLLVLEHLAGIERGDIVSLRRRRQIVHTPQRRAPIQMPQRPIRANSHGVRALARGQQPDLAGFGILNRLGRKRSGRQQEGTEESNRASHNRPPVYDVAQTLSLRHGGRHPCRVIPSTALMSTAAMPTGMAIFHPIFMSWS